MLYFEKERRPGTENLKTKLLGHLQAPLDKNSEEFDDVTVKTIYCFLSSLEWGPVGVFVLYLPFSRPIKPSLNYRKHRLSIMKHFPSPRQHSGLETNGSQQATG